MTASTKAPPAAQPIEGVAKTALVLRNSRLTPEQIDLLKKTVAKGASDDEFALFLELCNHTGLNPFARQIYSLRRRTKNEAGEWVNAMVTQVGIDGFRLIAERSEKYRGQTQPVYYDAGGNERVVWLDPKKPPIACKVGVLREGFTEPLFAIAHYDEYVQRTRDGSPNAMWRGKPTVMLAKCAEAMALRKAFPQELSGLYTEDELPGETIEDEPPHQIAATSTRARVVEPGTDGTARVDNDGEVIITFGRLKDRKLRQAPTSDLIELFRDPWKDESRRATAGERLGRGFVAAVYSELLTRNVPEPMTANIMRAIERAEKNDTVTTDEQEEVRQWLLDHPDVDVQKIGTGLEKKPVVAHVDGGHGA